MLLARFSPLAAASFVVLLGSVTAQEEMASPSQIHPRTNISVGFGFGKQTNETNTGNFTSRVVARDASSIYWRLRAEKFFESDFGVFVSGYIGLTDDINEDLGSIDSDQTNSGVFLAASYYSKMDDDFRMPVRFGPFFNRIELNDTTTSSVKTEYETWGMRLAVEPEFIFFQNVSNGKVQELTAFAELACGAGPTDYKSTDSNTGPTGVNGSEDGYAFTFTWELGLRFRLASGITASASYLAQKYHIGTSETYNGLVFFGVDDDFNGVMFSVGLRF